jgi:hypothetical protein
MVYLKLGLDIFLKRSIQTSIVNSHTVTYKSLAPADNPTQLEFNCSGNSDYYIDLNFVRLLLGVKLVKTDGSHLRSTEPNTVGCVINLLHSMLSSQFVSLMGNMLLFTKQIIITRLTLKSFQIMVLTLLVHI